MRKARKRGARALKVRKEKRKLALFTRGHSSGGGKHLCEGWPLLAVFRVLTLREGFRVSGVFPALGGDSGLPHGFGKGQETKPPGNPLPPNKPTMEDPVFLLK